MIEETHLGFLDLALDEAFIGVVADGYPITGVPGVWRANPSTTTRALVWPTHRPTRALLQRQFAPREDILFRVVRSMRWEQSGQMLLVARDTLGYRTVPVGALKWWPDDRCEAWARTEFPS